MKILRNRKRLRRYTLVELLVAMAVFSVLLVLSMQVFNGVQNLWLRSDQKNDTFAAARLAMEFIATRLQSISYSNETPWSLYDDDDEISGTKCDPGIGDPCHKIYFPTTMPMTRLDSKGKNLDAHSTRFLHFELNKGILVMKILGAKKENVKFFTSILPPYVYAPDESGENVNWARVKIKNYFENKNSNILSADSVEDWENADCITVCANVVSLRFIPRKADMSIDSTKNGTNGHLPYMFEIEMMILDSAEHYEQWKNAGASVKREIEQEFGYRFRRAVLIGDGRGL